MKQPQEQLPSTFGIQPQTTNTINNVDTTSKQQLPPQMLLQPQQQITSQMLIPPNKTITHVDTSSKLN